MRGRPARIVAARTMSATLAALVTLTCLVWSLPNYFEGMPSWYILFLSILGIFATLKYCDTESRYWLMLAGVCGGRNFISNRHFS